MSNKKKIFRLAFVVIVPFVFVVFNFIPRPTTSNFSNCPGIEVMDLNLQQDTVRGFPLPYLIEEATCPLVNCHALSCDENRLPNREFYIQGLIANLLIAGLLYIVIRIVYERLEKK